MQPSAKRASWAGPYQNGDRGNLPGSQRPFFPHIKDLWDQAALLDVDEHTSVSWLNKAFPWALINCWRIPQLNGLLGSARAAIHQCKVCIDKNHLDKAYVWYLRAFEITVNIIPRHSNYRPGVEQHPAWDDKFANLMQVSILITHRFEPGFVRLMLIVISIARSLTPMLLF
jgi:ubiquitin carboxyl-terminal hydrolase 8